MSRCFPFPPPGYVRKTKVAEDTDLLSKEKNKEKKHKKEKKDKDKKEGKEKHEKERSNEKHREKKDEKEKQRDKRKDKEKDRDKQKSDLLLSDEKKAVGSTDNHVHKLSEKSKEREIDRNVTSVEKRIGGVSGLQNGMPVSKNNPQVCESNKSFKLIPDVGRKTLDERRVPNQLSDKNFGTERKKDGGVVMAAKGGVLQESKERTKENPAFQVRLDGRGASRDARSMGSGLLPTSVGLVPNSAGVFQNRVGGNRPVEKKIEQNVDGTEKARETEWLDRKGDRRKEKYREKPFIKDKNGEKKEIMDATTLEEKHTQMTRMKDGGEIMLEPIMNDTKKDISGLQTAGVHNITKENNYIAANVNNTRKRKDPVLNGIYDELLIGSNKLARRTVSHLLTENGRSLELCRNSSAFAPGTQMLPVNIKIEPKLPHVDSTLNPPMRFGVDGKECKINGTKFEPCTQSSRETLSKDKQKAVDAPPKPPSHPDTKYLNEVLSVPKMSEWSDFVDQEWLFDSSSSSSRKQEVKLSEIAETSLPQVWARGEWLEPVDVYALPYVIPH